MKQFSDDKTHEQSHVIAYEIKRLNKLIVAEQSFSEVFKSESSKSLPGLSSLYSADKKVTLLVNAKVQATYDMQQMKIELDSVNRIIYIKKIPDIEIKTFPDVQFYDMDQSVFNKFSSDELNKIKSRAVENLEKKIDKQGLEKQAREQLLENLEQIYILGKLYNWEIKDDTSYARELKEKASNFNY